MCENKNLNNGSVSNKESKVHEKNRNFVSFPLVWWDLVSQKPETIKSYAYEEYREMGLKTHKTMTMKKKLKYI